MRIVLHNGMPKSGTTALQETLLKNRDILLEQGVLYPAGKGLPGNHNILVLGVSEPDKLPRLFKQVYSGRNDKIRRDFQAVLDGISESASRNKVHTVILSSEMLFRVLSAAQAETLFSSLKNIADAIDVVTYIRHPAEYYLAIVQQTLRASKIINPLFAINYRPIIDCYMRFADSVTVVPYIRSELHKGDITHDFFMRMLPQYVALLGRFKLRNSNETLSAEGMDVIQRYRAYACADQDNVSTDDAAVILKNLRSLDREVARFARPVLRSHVRDMVVRSAVDLPWLRDKFNIVFSDINYEEAFEWISSPPGYSSVHEICEVDADRRDKLMMLLMQRLAKAQSKGAVSFFSALPQTGQGKTMSASRLGRLLGLFGRYREK